MAQLWFNLAQLSESLEEAPIRSDAGSPTRPEELPEQSDEASWDPRDIKGGRTETEWPNAALLELARG